MYEKLIKFRDTLLQLIPLMQQYLTQVQTWLSELLRWLSSSNSNTKKELKSMNVLGPERVKVGDTWEVSIPGVSQLFSIVFEGETTNIDTSLANVKLSIECIATGMPYQYRPIDEYLVGSLLTGYFISYPRVPVHSGEADAIYKIDSSSEIEAQPVPPLIYGKATVMLEDFRELPSTDAYVWITLVME